MGTTYAPLGTNYASLVHSYGADFIQGLLRNKGEKVAQAFNFTFHYLNNALSSHNGDLVIYLMFVIRISYWFCVYVV